MKKIICSLLIATSFSVNAQQFNYTFSQSASSYTALQNANNVSETIQMENSYSLPIGFTFSFLGESFTSVSVNPVGYISFGGKNNFSFSLFESLHTNVDSGITPQIKYSTVGNAGNRICKIQFSDFGCGNSLSGEKLNFQLWLYEQNGKIEFHAGESSINTSSIGEQYMMLGPINRQQDSSPWAYLLNGNPASPETSLLTESTFNTKLTAVPANGTVYVFGIN